MADNTDKKKLLRSATCGTFLSSSHCRKCFMSSAINFVIAEQLWKCSVLLCPPLTLLPYKKSSIGTQLNRWRIEFYIDILTHKAMLAGSPPFIALFRHLVSVSATP